jgi:hypothetical protein
MTRLPSYARNSADCPNANAAPWRSDTWKTCRRRQSPRSSVSANAMPGASSATDLPDCAEDFVTARVPGRSRSTFTRRVMALKRRTLTKTNRHEHPFTARGYAMFFPAGRPVIESAGAMSQRFEDAVLQVESGQDDDAGVPGVAVGLCPGNRTRAPVVPHPYNFRSHPRHATGLTPRSASLYSDRQ